MIHLKKKLCQIEKKVILEIVFNTNELDFGICPKYCDIPLEMSVIDISYGPIGKRIQQTDGLISLLQDIHRLLPLKII